MAGSWMIKESLSQNQIFITYQRPLIDFFFFEQLEFQLKVNEINFFSDRDIDREGPEGILKRKIEESKIAIVIFSEKCTESTWWLRQLVIIADRVEKGKLVAFPIFYKLEPITINRLRGNTPYDFPRSDLEIWQKAVMLISNKNYFIVSKFESDVKKVKLAKKLMEEVKRVPKKNSLEKIKQRCKDLRANLVVLIGCLFFLYFSLQKFTITPLCGEGGGAINRTVVPKVVEYIPPERTEIAIDKNSEIVMEVPKELEYNPPERTEIAIDNDSRVMMDVLVEYIPAERTKIAIDKDSKTVMDVPKVLEYIPPQITIDTDDDFLTGKDGAKPESCCSSDAKTNAHLLDRTIANSPTDGKIKPPQIQVFINFRGVQLRNYFVGYLVHALQRREVNVFIDNYAKRGEDLNTLFKRIEDSGIAIVVFSTRYTESKWCLDELVKIKERVYQGLLKVLPIFYKVSPRDVKRLKGEFGDHFRDKEFMYEYDEPKIKRWKKAILFVSHKFALTFDEKSRELEIDFVETIVKEVLEMLQSISTVESSQKSS